MHFFFFSRESESWVKAKAAASCISFFRKQLQKETKGCRYDKHWQLIMWKPFCIRLSRLGIPLLLSTNELVVVNSYVLIRCKSSVPNCLCTPSWRAMAFIWIKHQSVNISPPPPLSPQRLCCLCCTEPHSQSCQPALHTGWTHHLRWWCWCHHRDCIVIKRCVCVCVNPVLTLIHCTNYPQ